MCTFTPWPYASHMAILCPRCSSIPHVVDSCLVEAARLRRSGAEWDASFEEAGVERYTGGRRMTGAPLWCGGCSSPTPVLGAAALGAAWGSSPGFSPARGGVAGHEQSGAWSSTTASVGR